MSPFSDRDADSAIVSIDPTCAIEPELLIADILRTRYCIKGSVLLVEAIDTHIPIERSYRTVRILLGDGELCIQALLRPDIHCFVDGGHVYEGCYVRLDDFELREVDVYKGEVGGQSKTRGKMVYLLVGNLITVGWNRDYRRLLGLGEPTRPAAIAASEEDTSGKIRSKWHSLQVKPRSTASMAQQMEPTRPAKDAQDGSDSEDGFEDLQVSVERAAGRRINQVPLAPGFASKDTAKSLPWMSNDPTQPLKLTNMASVPKLPYKQNWVCNVLAVVASLSDLEPSHLPPYTQRTARLTDPTTTKKVLLTVFLDPEAFSPAVGSVVLLIGVKNHRFDGGSLKKYASDKLKNGENWWVANPETLGWCEGEVMELKGWWHSRTTHET